MNATDTGTKNHHLKSPQNGDVSWLPVPSDFKLSCGTELDIVQEGVPEAIPVEMCYLGWQDSLEQLKHLVETEIPD